MEKSKMTAPDFSGFSLGHMVKTKEEVDQIIIQAQLFLIHLTEGSGEATAGV
jgi:hypothetical protein